MSNDDLLWSKLSREEQADLISLWKGRQLRLRAQKEMRKENPNVEFTGKNYGSVPHLLGSKMTSREDKGLNEGQTDIAFGQKPGRKSDVIYITEKLDGANVGVWRDPETLALFPLTRSGGLAYKSKFPHLRMFARWVNRFHDNFAHLLGAGERVVGEWLYLAHGTRYGLENERELFVGFDMFDENNERLPFMRARNGITGVGLAFAPLIHIGGEKDSRDPEELLVEYPFGAFNAKDRIEGFVYRVETDGQFNFHGKYVRHDYEPGRYLFDKQGKELPLSELLYNFSDNFDKEPWARW